MMSSQFETHSKRAMLGLLLTCLTLLTARAQSNNVAAYTWTTFAGFSTTGSADGVGTDAQFNSPNGIAADQAGNLYVADSKNCTIRRITPAGVVSTIAGFPGVTGNTDGINSAARFFSPVAITVDGAGNLYVCDYSAIRRIAPSGTNWVVSTIAGVMGTFGSTDGVGSGARFYIPYGIAADGAGNLYVADTFNHTIRMLTSTGTNWVASTIAGLAGNGGSADGTGTNAQFSGPHGITVDHAGNLYVADTYNATIRMITPVNTNWIVSTIAGVAGVFGSTDGTGTNALFGSQNGYGIAGVVVDRMGDLYVMDSANDTIRQLTHIMGTKWVVSTLAGRRGIHGTADGVGTNAEFYLPQGIAIDGADNLYVADTGNNMIRAVSSLGEVSTFAGSGGVSAGGGDGTGGNARFNTPVGVATDQAGNIYVVDSHNDTVRKVTPAGLVTTVAGLAGSPGSTDGVGDNARFNFPVGVTVDTNDDVYVVDTGNKTIREITRAGLVITIAGSSTGYSGHADGNGTNASFATPYGITVDKTGNLYVADSFNRNIRMLTSTGTNWVVTTIAGGPYGSDDGVGTNAQFTDPFDIAADSAGNLYVADNGNNEVIREIMPVGTNWVVNTIAGSAGNLGFNDGTGTNAQFLSPTSVAVDSGGNVYVTDENAVRKLTTVDGTNWAVSTIGGSSYYTGSADGAGSAARFYTPSGIAVDSAGNLYVADTVNNSIRKGVFTAYGSANKTAYSAPAMNSSLTVTLLPAEANGQWRFPWEVAWRNSGQAATGLVAGNYPVEFRTLPDWLAIPSDLTVAVAAGGITFVTNQYFPTISTVDTNNGGSLTVTLGPSPPSGAGWRFLGDTTPFYPSGYSTNLIAGTYLIEFAAISGRVKPPNLSVQVLAGLPTLLAENYLLAQPAPDGVLLPFPVPGNEIGDIADYPFGFNGQLQSDVGFGSGVAVEANVVLTVAHIVFDDQTLSYVSQAYWYFQREVGTFDPEPLAARGWYVLSGYASQRTNDLEVYAPNTSTPQSRNLDVAALYFLSPVAGGGYSGYLPSDETPNPWLTGNSLKMLVGYPVDGSEFGNASITTNAGTMYQTDPQPFALSLATDPVDDQQVYTANWFLSYPGNSGGPLYVQYNGYYYPGGVYSGTLYNGVTPYASAVRAIDSQVMNLITNAEYLGDAGTNHPGGGVITIIPNQAVSASNPGYLQFQLGPPAAVVAGAGWQLQGDTSYSSATNYIRAVLSTNSFTVLFKQINGWNVPTNQSVSVQPGQIAVYSAFYTLANSLQIVSPQVSGGNFNLSFQSVSGQSYTLYYNNNLATTNWLPYTNVSGNGGTLQLTVPITNSTQRFFRISQP